VELICRGNATCQGQLELLGPRASIRAATAARTVSYGKARYSIRAGATTKLKVSLNAGGRRLLRTRKQVRLALRLTPRGGGAVVTSRVTLTRSPKRQ